MIGKTHLDLTPYLNHMLESPQKLLGYYEANSAPLAKGRLTNACWEKSDPAYGVVVAWFESRPVQEVLAQAYGM